MRDASWVSARRQRRTRVCCDVCVVVCVCLSVWRAGQKRAAAMANELGGGFERRAGSDNCCGCESSRLSPAHVRRCVTLDSTHHAHRHLPVCRPRRRQRQPLPGLLRLGLLLLVVVVRGCQREPDRPAAPPQRPWRPRRRRRRRCWWRRWRRPKYRARTVAIRPAQVVQVLPAGRRHHQRLHQAQQGQSLRLGRGAGRRQWRPQRGGRDRPSPWPGNPPLKYAYLHPGKTTALARRCELCACERGRTATRASLEQRTLARTWTPAGELPVLLVLLLC